MEVAVVPAVFVVICVIALILLSLVYKFGIKEKSYEEALAEQRQNTHALLSNKPKPKEKKNKKAVKKVVKEKDRSEDAKQSELKDEVNEEVSDSQNPKLHVEFKTEVEEVPLKEVPQIKKKSKKEKVKPILIHKEVDNNLVDTDVETAPSANHFEESHPKDDCELMRSNSISSSKDDLTKVTKDKVKNKPSSDAEAPKKKEDVAKKDSRKKEESSKQELKKKEDAIKQEMKKKDETVKQQPKNKEVDGEESPKKEKESPNEHEKDQSKKKLKPVDIATASSVVEEKEAVKEIKNNAINITSSPVMNGTIHNTGKEKKKKKNDLNSLHQLALEKDVVSLPLLVNLVREADLSRSEVQRLIDMLLNKQHEAPDILSEWSEGKADQVQKLKKQLAEKEKALQEEQEALTGAQSKLREVRNEQMTERSQYQQKIRGLEEILQSKQLEIQAGNNRFHNQNQQYQQLQAQFNEERNAVQMQIQQYEMRLAQIQEIEGINVQLSEENQQLHHELQRLNDEKAHHQNVYMQLSSCEEDLKQKIDSIRILESNLEIMGRKENDYNSELSRLEGLLQQRVEEIENVKAANSNASEEVQQLRSNKEQADILIKQLQAELQKSLEEQSKLREKQSNGSVQDNESHEVEILNLQNALSSMKTELQQVEKKYKSELDTTQGTLKKLEGELIEQKAKNNELRTRNWKVMEALNTAESRLRSNKCDIDMNKLTSEVRQKEIDSQIEFIKRLFPDLEVISSISPSDDNWQVTCSEHIKAYIGSLQQDDSKETKSTSTSELNKVKAENQHYKSIIDETEKQLNLIQSSVEQEEIKWRMRLQLKDAELEALKEQFTNQTIKTESVSDCDGVEFAFQCIEKSLPVITEELKEKVSRLEQDLEIEKKEKEKLANECHHLKSTLPGNDSLAVIEKLSQEVANLRENLLKCEQEKNGDIDSCQKARNCNSTNGPSLIQRCSSSSSSSTASSSGEISVRKSKKKKKPTTN